MLDDARNRFETFRETLHAGRPAFGLVMQSTMTSRAEIMAMAGYDFTWIDMEHTA